MPVYDVEKEYINITNYSPFCHINEVSEQYRDKPFMLPYYAFSSDDVRPVHPDTFTDLGHRTRLPLRTPCFVRV